MSEETPCALENAGASRKMQKTLKARKRSWFHVKKEDTSKQAWWLPWLEDVFGQTRENHAGHMAKSLLIKRGRKKLWWCQCFGGKQQNYRVWYKIYQSSWHRAVPWAFLNRGRKFIKGNRGCDLSKAVKGREQRWVCEMTSMALESCCPWAADMRVGGRGGPQHRGGLENCWLKGWWLWWWILVGDAWVVGQGRTRCQFHYSPHAESCSLSLTGNLRGWWADRALLGWRAAEINNWLCVHRCAVLKAVGMLTSPLKLRGR